MKWNKCFDKEGLPQVKKDTDILIKPENLPFTYLYVVWDGRQLWRYSGKPNFPWDILLDNVHFKEWAYID